MKKILFIILIIVLAAGGYYAYQYWQDNRSINAWSLVPEDAYFVYEVENAFSLAQKLDGVKTGFALKALPAFSRANDYLLSLDSLSGKNGSFSALFEDNPLLISGHAVSSDKLDFLFVIEVQHIRQHTLITTLANDLKGKFTNNTRTYLGNTISEIADKETLFTYIYYKNFIVGSFTPYLVEDAIRTFSDDERRSFVEAHRPLFQLAKLSQDDGNLYINTTALGGLTETFADNVKKDFKFLNTLSDHTFLDLQFTEDLIVFNGFSINDLQGPNLLDAFDDNPGVPFSLHDMIPNNTAWLLHASFSEPSKWTSKWATKWPEQVAASTDYVKFLNDEYDINLKSFHSWLGNEIALIEVENANPQLQSLLAIVDARDVGEAYKQLNVISERMAQNDNDSVYLEPYGEQSIRQLKIEELPQLLFGPIFSGFESTFYLPYDGRIVMANNDQVLKQLIDDIENENTWGKSIRTRQFFDVLNKEANLNIIVDINRSWKNITGHLRTDWAAVAEENAAVMRSFEMAAAQFSNIDNKYYTNVALYQPGAYDVRKGATDYNIERSITFPHQIVTRPYFSRSHVDRSIEFAMQDSAGNFYHLDKNLEVLWSDSLSGQINSELYQIDYFLNKKLQFAFATPDRLLGIDRTGESLPDYPIRNPASDPIAFFSVIDYDNSKNYRLITASTKGDVHLMDKSGKRLDGWNPLRLGGALGVSPFHLRISGRDLILAPQQNGVINVLNRRGSSYNGFPLDLKSAISTGFYINKGSSFGNSSLTTINEQGEIVSFNLEGAITRREQLYKPKPASRFAIVEDALGNGYVIGRKDDTRVGVLDQSGNILFEKDYLSTGDIDFQYYNFGAGIEVIVLIDKDQQYAYLYDRKGVLIHFKPLETAFPIGLIYSEVNKEFNIFKVFENEFSVLTLKASG